MANEVFANGLEIACKAADGVSSAAFPDVCFTPKVPVPFANTALAKDTTNGSKTVLISGKEVVLKDYSYIKTSSGDTGAKGKKGLATSAKNGKAYFRSWSMNVKVEGYNVCRHTDSMTHNHGSFPGNTGQWKYIDTADEKKACKKDKDKMDKACEEKKQKTVTNKKGKKEQVDTKITAKKQIAGSWKKKHCGGLNTKPYSDTIKKEDLEKLKEKAEKSIESFDAIDTAMDKLIQEIENIALKKGSIKAAKMLAKKPLQAVLGPLGWAWAAYDVYDGISTVSELKAYLNNVKNAAKELKKLPAKVAELGDLIENFDKVKASKAMAEIQKNLATINPCLRARKCMLVPHTQTENKLKGNGGCCNGQTGHHIIPDSYMKESECDGYKKGIAPTVCVEGTNQHDGSHGDIHTALEKSVAGEGNITYAGLKDPTIDYDNARDAGAESHNKAFPLSGCNPKCLKAQMDNYRDEACGKGENPELNYVQIVPIKNTGGMVK